MHPGARMQNHPLQQRRRRRRLTQADLFSPEWLSQRAEVSGELDDVDDRETPEDLFGEYHARYRFTVDAAAAAHNAKLPRFWTRADNGLVQPWAGEYVWCNPPFSNLLPWVAKAHAEIEAPVVVMLVPANRTEQPWWQGYVEPYRDRGEDENLRALATEFKAKRRRFKVAGNHLRGGKAGQNPPFGIVMLIWVRTPF